LGDLPLSHCGFAAVGSHLEGRTMRWDIKGPYKLPDGPLMTSGVSVIWDEEEFDNMILPEYFRIYVQGPFGQAVRVR